MWNCYQSTAAVWAYKGYWVVLCVGSVRQVVDIFIRPTRTSDTFQGGTVYPSSPGPPSSPAPTEYSSAGLPDKVRWVNLRARVCLHVITGKSSPPLMHHFVESGRLAREANICEMRRLNRTQLLSIPTPPTLPRSDSSPSSSLPRLLIALLFLLRSYLPPVSLFFPFFQNFPTLLPPPPPPYNHSINFAPPPVPVLLSLHFVFSSSSSSGGGLTALPWQRHSGRTGSSSNNYIGTESVFCVHNFKVNCAAVYTHTHTGYRWHHFWTKGGSSGHR